MKIHQLSLFIENRQGQLRMPCRLLAEAGINIQTLMLADTQQFGILRLIVKDWQRAKKVLEEGGCAVKVSEALALEVNDQPGGMDAIMAVIECAGLNVEYMYAFASGREGRAVLIFRFEEIDKAIAALQAGGVNMLDSVALYEPFEK